MKRRTPTPEQKAAARSKRMDLVKRSVPLHMARKSGALPWAELPTLNACLEIIYRSETGQDEFHTFQGWREAGFIVEKGAKGFSIWGKPIRATEGAAEGGESEGFSGAEAEAARGFSFFPLSYLFHAGQVRSKDGQRPPSYRPAAEEISPEPAPVAEDCEETAALQMALGMELAL